jgi:ABC-type lipoprotein export system ATPase subunit
LLADEPSGELDAANAAVIRDLITSVSRELGSSAVIASHDPAMASAAARVVVVRDGRVVEERRDGITSAVLGHGGWLPVPPGLLDEAGISGTARISRAGDGSLRVRPATGHNARTEVAAAGAEAFAAVAAGWRPIRTASVEASMLTCSRGRGRGRRLVLDGFGHIFAPGVLTVVTGRSGSGKTTLLQLLAGLDVPDGGEVLLDGEPLSARTAEGRAALRRARIAYLPQEPTPAGFLSATENIVLALQLRGVAREPALTHAAAVLEQTRMSERADQPAFRLSAGEAQRLGLARALACSTGLLILDEPTSRLDRLAAETVAQGLSATARDQGQTIICATHDPELIALAGAVVELGRLTTSCR